MQTMVPENDQSPDFESLDQEFRISAVMRNSRLADPFFWVFVATALAIAWFILSQILNPV